jgi:hypothetical protein
MLWNNYKTEKEQAQKVLAYSSLSIFQIFNIWKRLASLYTFDM